MLFFIDLKEIFLMGFFIDKLINLLGYCLIIKYNIKYL